MILARVLGAALGSEARAQGLLEQLPMSAQLDAALVAVPQYSADVVDANLCLLANHEDTPHPDGGLYLRRWRLFGYKARLPALDGFSILVHRFHTPDIGEHPHTHPWDYWSLVLRGYYVETLYNYQQAKTRGRRDHDGGPYAWASPGGLWAREGRHLHHIREVGPEGCWTVVVTGPVKRSWQWWTPRGLEPGREGYR